MPEDRKFIPLDDSAPTPVSSKIKLVPPDPGRKFIPIDSAPSFFKSPISKAPDLPGGLKYPEPDLKDSAIDLTAGALPMVGGIAGGAFGGPGGAAVGAGTGSVVRDLIQTKNNTGEDLSVPEQLLSFGKNAALAGAGNKVSQLAAEAFPGDVKSRIASTLANTVFGSGVRATENLVNGAPSSGPKDFMQDLLTNGGFELVGGHLIKKKVGPLPNGEVPPDGNIQLQEGYGREREQAKIGQGPLPNDTPASRNTEQIGTEARNTVVKNFKAASALEKKQYAAFDTNHVQQNSLDIPQFKGWRDTGIIDPSTGKTSKTPILEMAHVTGAIYTPNATKLAADFKPQLEAFVKGPEYSRLPDYQQQKFQQALDGVNRLLEGVPTFDVATNTNINVPVLDFATAKEMKTIISQTVGGKGNKTFGEGGLTKLAQALDQDIDTSVSGWKNGKQAKFDLDQAHQTSKFKNMVFKTADMQRRLYGKNQSGRGVDTRIPGDASQFFEGAYDSPENARRMMSALGPENQGIIKEDYLDNQLLQKGFGTNFNKFEPRGIINELENPNSISRTILSADERNNMLRFMRSAESSVEGKGTVSFQAGNISFALGKAARYMTGNPLTDAVVRIGAREFMHKMVENPAAFEYATRLVKTPVGGQDTEQLSKLLMKSLRGTEVTLTTGKREKKAFVNDAGKVQLREEN